MPELAGAEPITDVARKLPTVDDARFLVGEGDTYRRLMRNVVVDRGRRLQTHRRSLSTTDGFATRQNRYPSWSSSVSYTHLTLPTTPYV